MRHTTILVQKRMMTSYLDANGDVHEAMNDKSEEHSAADS